MMGDRIPMESGDEYDALTRAKRFYRWRPGQRRRIKRAYRRRERQAAWFLAEAEARMGDEEWVEPDPDDLVMASWMLDLGHLKISSETVISAEAFDAFVARLDAAHLEDFGQNDRP